LHAGEVASAFIQSVAKPRDAARVFDINGVVATVEESIKKIEAIAPSSNIKAKGPRFPSPRTYRINRFEITLVITDRSISITVLNTPIRIFVA
jgi:hypothetical protein